MKDEEYVKFQEEVLKEIFPVDKLPEDIQNNLRDYIIFRHELTIESDRGSALLAAAYLDSLLEKSLRNKMFGSKNHLDKLFNFSGPLGTFSGRISIAFSIGLLSKNEINDIDIIRKIRNEFGHSPSVIDFDDKKISSLCDNLKCIARKKSKKSRQKFNTSVSFLAGGIESSLFTQESFKEKTKDNLEKVKEFVKFADKQLKELFNQENL